MLDHNITENDKNSKIDSLLRQSNQEKQENSYIGQIGKLIEPIIAPLGFD
jgi:ferrous iron transport protein B